MCPTELSIRGWPRSCYLCSVLFGPARRRHVHSSARNGQVQLGMRRVLAVLAFLKVEAELSCVCCLIPISVAQLHFPSVAHLRQVTLTQGVNNKWTLWASPSPLSALNHLWCLWKYLSRSVVCNSLLSFTHSAKGSSVMVVFSIWVPKDPICNWKKMQFCVLDTKPRKTCEWAALSVVRSLH